MQRSASLSVRHYITRLTRTPDRKVMCDRGLPTCRTCTRIKRHCLGYGVRLSWPKAKEHRRLIVAATPISPARLQVRSSRDHRHFVNMTALDMEVFHHISDPTSKNSYMRIVIGLQLSKTSRDYPSAA